MGIDRKRYRRPRMAEPLADRDDVDTAGDKLAGVRVPIYDAKSGKIIGRETPQR